MTFLNHRACLRSGLRAGLLAATCVSTLATLPSYTMAQDQAAEVGGLEEIVVTSRKREEKLFDVPIAITAFNSADLEKAQLFDIRQVATLSPGLSFQNVSGKTNPGRSNPALFIRGMTTTASGTSRQATSAVFVDGIFVLGGISSINTVDVERVEVIKGPQNAYYGRNTFAGAVNFITKNPGNNFKGEIRAEGTTQHSNELSVSVEGPLVEDVLAGRISVLTHEKGSMYTATDGGKLGEESTQSITGTLFATPNDQLTLRVRAHYQEDDDGPASWGYLAGTKYGNNSCAGKSITGADRNGVPGTFAVTQPYFCGSIPTLSQVGEQVISSNTNLRSPFMNSLGNPNGLINAFFNNSLNHPLIARAPKLDHMGMKREMLRLNGTAQYEFANEITATLNMAYNQNDTLLVMDTDKTDLENVYAAAPALYDDYSAELRLQSSQSEALRWMVGGNMYRGAFDADYSGAVTMQVRFTPVSAQNTGPTAFVPFNANGERARVYAGFGSLEYDILDNLTLSGELRYQTDRSKTQPSNVASQYAKFNDWLPRVILNYKPEENWTLYASWARGVLPGQFNTSYINATAAQKAYLDSVVTGITPVLESQRVDSYEIGSKQQLLDNRLQYTIALYKMNWANLPSSSTIAIPGTTTPLTVSVYGDAKLKGLEFETTALLAPGWDASLRFNWQEGTYTNYTQGLVATGLVVGLYGYNGKKLPRVPQYSGSFSTGYRAGLSGDWDWFVRADAAYTGKSWDSEANIVKTDDYIRTNARIGVENQDLMIELFAKNLFNDKHWDYAFRNASFGEAGSLQILQPG
ncbi:MAG: TonB-dependent receptor, partial [Rhodospirillaceae bacterium]|nr:TonB-dependent receptor [Rhodospirillaceae bacterium]